MKELTKKVQSLGGSVTALADDASHLVTNKFIRTIKWFVAMNKGMVQPEFERSQAMTLWPGRICRRRGSEFEPIKSELRRDVVVGQ